MRKKTGLLLILLILTINIVVGVNILNEQEPYFLSYQQTSRKQISTSFILGNETQVNSYRTQFGHSNPSISSFNSTSFLISWYGLGWASNGDDIYVDHFNSAAYNYTDDVLVNSNLSNTQQGPAVSSISDGSGFVVAWHCYRNGTGESDIYVKIFNQSASNTTDDILVNRNRTANQQYPSVGCFSDGSFVIAWSSNQDGDDDIYVKIFNSTGHNVTDDILVNTIISNNQRYSDICVQSDGSFVVTWYGYGLGDTVGVFMKIFNSTGYNITDEILVNSYIGGNQRYPSICSFSDDSYIISWDGSGIGDNAGIYAKIFNSTGFNKTGDILINANTTNTQSHPSVSCFSDTSFVISWHGAGKGDDIGIFTRMFNSIGQNKSDDIRVNENTTGIQQESAVSCLVDGSFVVTWQSDQNGSWDVFFRVITPAKENGRLLGLELLLFLQPSTGINQILVITGILVAVVLIIVIVYLIKRR